MKRKTPKYPSGLTFILSGIFILNLLILDYFVIRLLSPSVPMVLGQTDSSQCPQSCLTYIDRRTQTSVSSAKEFYVPLGAGTVASREWTDVAGAQGSVDTRSYGAIKETTFEATVTVPTGNQTVWIRLYNATDKHPVWHSELTMSGTGPTLLTSPKINLDSGLKTYVVQLKSQLGYPANITQSRIRITTR